jgi:hypothetical protein
MTTAAAPETGKTNTEPATAATTDPKAAPETGTTVTGQPDGKPAAEATTKQPDGTKTPESKPLELKLPEGSHLAADAVEKIAARAKELNWTPEQAQAELQRESDMVKSFVEGEKQKLAQEVTAWVDASKKDTEIGGEKFAQSAEIAKRVVNRFGTEAFKKALNETGLGNHPELVRVFVRIGRAMTDDQLVIASGQPTAPRSAADVLYGETSTTKEK